MLFVLALVGLTVTPWWLPGQEFHQPVRVEFAPDAEVRVRGWVNDLPTLRASPELRVSRIEVKRDAIRLDIEGPGWRGAALELRSIAEGRRGPQTGKSMTIYVISPREEERRKLNEVAAELASRDDGSAVKSCVQAPLPRASRAFAWLGLGPALAAVLLALRDRLRLPSARDAFFKRTHLLPMALQFVFFLYWSVYWPPVRVHGLSVLAQLLFGYALDVLLAWGLRRPWPGLLAVGAPVLSTNLFVWFTGQDLWFSFALIAVALGSKALLRRQESHIFNPSALATALAALLVLCFPARLHHIDIAAGISAPPSMSELMFLATLIPLGLLRTAPIPLGAALALTLLQKILGHGPGFTWPGWFLAITIFAGDPATVPRSPAGRFLFGLSVGAGMQLSSMILMATVGMDFWAKVLPIPLLNLATPWFDRVGPPFLSRVASHLGRLQPPTTWIARRPMLAWSALFLLVFTLSKRVGFSRRAHEEWGTPLIHFEPDGSIDCGANPAFCKPFRVDLELAAWWAQRRR
jgi:hypothetical protein